MNSLLGLSIMPQTWGPTAIIVACLAGILALCYAIYRASDIFEDSTGYLGRNMGNGVKGALINAVGSSTPELITSFIFLFTMNATVGYEGTIGTTAGSAVFNALLIPAAVIILVYKWKLLKPEEAIPLSKYVVSRDGSFLIISEIALISMVFSGNVEWYHGAGLMSIYVIYVMVLLRDSKRPTEGADAIVFDPGTSKQYWNSMGKLVWSIALMTLFCWGLVVAVEEIGIAMGINLIFTSVILAAAASSVPDLIISIKDAKAGNYDDAVSNAIGSNIFDICIAHGLPIFLYCLLNGGFKTMHGESNDSMVIRIVLLILTAIAILLYRRKKGVTKGVGYALIGLYVVFVGVIVYQASAYL